MKQISLIILAILLSYGSARGQFGGGTGAPENPFLIFTAQEFVNIGKYPAFWGSHFRLMKDLDLSDYKDALYSPIGVNADVPFTGVFDGGGYEIRHFHYRADSHFYAGLFGVIMGPSAEIRDLGLRDVQVITSVLWVGTLAGLVHGRISNCYIDGGQVGGFANVGGLIGENASGVVENCYAIAYAFRGANIGGLVGYNTGVVSRCFADGVVSGKEKSGGLVGWNGEAGQIVNSFSTSQVWSTGRGTGGLAGFNGGTIQNTYSSGPVRAVDFVGGLIGSNNLKGQVGQSFWDIQGSGQEKSVAGLGLTAAQMVDEQTFARREWDFQSVWDLCQGTASPRLTQIHWPRSDFSCPGGVHLEDLLHLADNWMLPTLAADVNPIGGDGIVNWIDWNALVAAWQSTADEANWNPACDIAPAGGDGFIGWEDLLLFAEQWTQKGAGRGDIAPGRSGDQWVDYKDFAQLARDWGRNY